MPSSADKLRECPFCGGEAKQAVECENGKGWVFCANCGACSRIANHIDHAIGYWNTRATPSDKRVGAETQTAWPWRTMESAPKDGYILAYVPGVLEPDGEIIMVIWDLGSWMDDYGFTHTPTHWMPLPSPPAVDALPSQEKP